MVISSRGERLQPFEEFGLAAHVEMRGRLVEEQHLRLADQHAGEADGLLLAAGQAAAALGNRHVVAQRMAGDEALDAGKPRRREDFFVGGLRLAERDVVAQLAEEQVGVLQHKANAGAQIGRVVLADVDAVDQDAALLRLIEAEQQAADRRLARADAADDADALAGRDLERNLLERVLGSVRVAEGDVLECDAAVLRSCAPHRCAPAGVRAQAP